MRTGSRGFSARTSVAARSRSSVKIGGAAARRPRPRRDGAAGEPVRRKGRCRRPRPRRYRRLRKPDEPVPQEGEVLGQDNAHGSDTLTSVVRRRTAGSQGSVGRGQAPLDAPQPGPAHASLLRCRSRHPLTQATASRRPAATAAMQAARREEGSEPAPGRSPPPTSGGSSSASSAPVIPTCGSGARGGSTSSPPARRPRLARRPVPRPAPGPFGQRPAARRGRPIPSGGRPEPPSLTGCGSDRRTGSDSTAEVTTRAETALPGCGRPRGRPKGRVRNVYEAPAEPARPPGSSSARRPRVPNPRPGRAPGPTAGPAPAPGRGRRIRRR